MANLISFDNAESLVQQINDTTREFVSKTSLDCATAVKQLEDVEIKNTKVGGDFALSQNAAIVNNCAQQVKNKQELFNEIASDVIQKTEQEKGSNNLFSLVGASNADNETLIKETLRDEYKKVEKLNCDVKALQSRKLKFDNVDIKGSFSSSQNVELSSDCQQMAELARNVVDKVTRETDQSSKQTVPPSVWAIVIGAVLLLGMLASLVYAYMRSKQEDQQLQQQQQMMFMQQQQQQPQFYGTVPQTYGGF